MMITLRAVASSAAARSRWVCPGRPQAPAARSTTSGQAVSSKSCSSGAERDGDFVRVRPPERGESTTTHQEGWKPGVLALFRLRKSQHKCSETVAIHRIAFRRRTSYLSEGHGVDAVAINRPRRTITAAPARQHPARYFRQPPGCRTPVPWLPLPWHRQPHAPQSLDPADWHARHVKLLAVPRSVGPPEQP